MDCSSPYAMASLIAARDEYGLATGNDADADRHGIVTPDAGLLNPNHFLAVAISYLYANREGWSPDAAIGKTLVSSSMIDRVAEGLGRRLVAGRLAVRTPALREAADHVRANLLAAVVHHPRVVVLPRDDAHAADDLRADELAADATRVAIDPLAARGGLTLADLRADELAAHRRDDGRIGRGSDGSADQEGEGGEDLADAHDEPPGWWSGA